MGATCRRSCGARWRWRSRTNPTTSPRSSRRCASRCSCSSGRRTRRSCRVARRWPARSRGAQLVVIPDAGHSPQFENPHAWIEALDAVPRVGSRARQLARSMEAHGGRLAVEVLQRHGVDTMFTLSGGHLFVLVRRRGADRAAARRRPARADRDVRGRRLGEGDAPARLRGAHRRARRDQRRERDDRRVDERLADRRAGGPGAAAALGRGFVAGARPRSDRRVGHEDGRRPRPRPRRSSPRSMPRAGPRAPRTAARRSSTSRSTRSGPVRVELPAVSGADGFRGDQPDPDAVARVAQLVAASTAAGAVVAAATSTGRTRKHRCARSSEAARVPVFVNGMGRGTLPADHELAFSRARSIALKQADLVLVAGTPLDFRLGFGRFGDAQVVHLCDAATRSRRARRRSRRRRPVTWRRRSPRWPKRRAPRRAHDDWIALPPRRRAVEARRGSAVARGRHRSPIKPARDLRRADASASTATRS